MKPKFIIFLALLMSLAIFAPSLRALLNLDAKKSLVVDFNEEEQNETEDQLDQHEFLSYQNTIHFVVETGKQLRINGTTRYQKNNTPLDILSPPPRFLS